MSYTFGAGTGDDIAVTSALSLGADNTQVLVCGWWYPTTLTATRGYWSAGNIFGAEVDTTTSEIRMLTDNTTDGVWVTSGAGITTNKWHFIAWLCATENTTVAGAWRVWVGDENTAPVIQTPTNSTPRNGNYTGSTAVAIGNKGTGVLAFQGDIGWVSIIAASAPGINSPLYIGTSGAIADAEAKLVEERWVLPIWRGRPDPMFCVPTTMAGSFTAIHMCFCQAGGPAAQWSNSTGPGNPLAMTINGATFSDNQPPVRMERDWVLKYPFVAGR